MIPFPALWRVAVGAALSVAIGLLAFGRGSLTGSGVVGATLIGTLVFGFGGAAAAFLLVAFFVAASLLSRLGRAAKHALAEKFAKGARRDFSQALANGGLAAALATVYFYFAQDWVWAALVGALATVNADTWATELGVLANRRPRLITSGRPVAVGASGAVSLPGALAAAAGAMLIALLAGGLWIFAGRSAPAGLALAGAATVAGLAGAFVDSLFGATVQAMYHCPTCEKETERHPFHSCGAATRQTRGWRWLDNDWVNLLSSAVGAVVAAAVFFLAR